MELVLLLGLCGLHFITGAGILRLFGLREQDPLVRVALYVITGIIIASVSCFALQLVYIPLTVINVYGTLLGLALLLNAGRIAVYKRRRLPRMFPVAVRLYEWPFILFIGYALIGSAWRCYYLPPQARDLMSGPEAIAAFALKEYTFINSIFRTNLESTNNQFKSPFLHSLLLIYKMAGFKYGGLWLSQISFCFMLLVFKWLKALLHPVLAGLLSMLLLSAPEFFAYTYLILYDYSNAVFFFIGYYYLLLYMKDWQRPHLLLTALMFAASVYVRSETFILVGLMLPLFLVRGWKDKLPAGKLVFRAACLTGMAFLGYFTVVEVYNNHYLPQQYHVLENLMNRDPGNLRPFFERAGKVWDSLITGDWSITLYGYIFYAFFVCFGAELVLRRQFSRSAVDWLYGIFAVYFGLLLTGFLFPLMDIDNSTKRGLFKVLPLIIFYLGNNHFIRTLSDKIRKMEFKSSRRDVSSHKTI